MTTRDILIKKGQTVAQVEKIKPKETDSDDEPPLLTYSSESENELEDTIEESLESSDFDEYLPKLRENSNIEDELPELESDESDNKVPNLVEESYFYKRPIGEKRTYEYFNNEEGEEIHIINLEKEQAKEQPIPTFNLEATNLTVEQKKELVDMVKKYRECFEDPLLRPGQIKGAEATIPTIPGAIPTYHKGYRRAPSEHKILAQDVEKYLKMGVIEPCNGPWSSPPLYAPKKTGELRFCVNYRDLNKKTIGDVYPLPNISDMMDVMSGAKYFSILDATSGYWQISIKKKDRPKTGFTTREGLFQFTVVPFGLKNAPSLFQRVMNSIFTGLLWKCCLLYMDDLLVFSKTFEEHIEALEKVFQRAKDRNLKFHPLKCELFLEKIEFLGHEVSAAGIHTSPKKVDTILRIMTPNTAKEAHHFICMAGYYRKFIKDFAGISKPIHNAVHAECFKWTPECQQAFEEIKRLFTKPPILAHPDFNKPFEVECDASQTQIGMVLNQRNDQGIPRPIHFASKLLSKTEQNYSATERECLAVITAVNIFRPYLYGRPFTIITDHKALVWLDKHKNDKSKLMKWSLELQEYDYQIIYRLGTDGYNVDALSRLSIAPEETKMNEMEVNTTMTEKENLQLDQMREPLFKDLIIYITKRITPKDGKVAKEIITLSQYFKVEDGILYHIWVPQEGRQKEEIRRQVALPLGWKYKALEECHDSNMTGGHLGFNKTYNKIRERYWWKNMYSETKNWIDTCKICAQKKGHRPENAGLLQPIIAKEPFDIVGMDFFGPLPLSKSKNAYVLSFTDHFSKWIELFPVARGNEEEVAKVLVEGIISRHGAMNQLISDRGQAFVSGVINEVYKLFKIRKIQTSAWHPQANGQTERFNKSLANMLSVYCDEFQQDWDLLLPYLAFAYNSAFNETTKV